MRYAVVHSLVNIPIYKYICATVFIDIALRADLDTITFIAHADRQWDKTTLDKPI